MTIRCVACFMPGNPAVSWEVLFVDGPPGVAIYLPDIMSGEQIFDNQEVLDEASQRISRFDELSAFIRASGSVWVVNLDALPSHLKAHEWKLGWLHGEVFIKPRVRAKSEVDKRGTFRYKFSVELWISEDSRMFNPQHSSTAPPAITDSLRLFREKHPDPMRAAFIMMKFGPTQGHGQLVKEIQRTLDEFGIAALRADEHEYADDLFANIQTYMHGCGFGIAVFERYMSDDFNPNVALEVGYMMAMPKPVCLLKDSTIKSLQTDMIGKLYKQFDPQDVRNTLAPSLREWVRQKIVGTQIAR